MNLLHKFLPRIEFNSYEDFKANYRVNVPESFNFAYDIIDEYARLAPEKLALVWYNDEKKERRLTHTELAMMSRRAANFFVSKGIKKGDTVLFMLKHKMFR